MCSVFCFLFLFLNGTISVFMISPLGTSIPSSMNDIQISPPSASSHQSFFLSEITCSGAILPPEQLTDKGETFLLLPKSPFLVLTLSSTWDCPCHGVGPGDLPDERELLTFFPLQSYILLSPCHYVGAEEWRCWEKRVAALADVHMGTDKGCQSDGTILSKSSDKSQNKCWPAKAYVTTSFFSASVISLFRFS